MDLCKNIIAQAEMLCITVTLSVISNRRICEYIGISDFTRKEDELNNDKLTATQQHFIYCNHAPALEDFSILTTERNYVKFKIKKSLLIERDKPAVDKAETMHHVITIYPSACVHNHRWLISSILHFFTSTRNQAGAIVIIVHRSTVAFKALAFESQLRHFGHSQNSCFYESSNCLTINLIT